MRSSSSILDLFEKKVPVSPKARAASTGALAHTADHSTVRLVETADHSTVREGDADVWNLCSPGLCGNVSREVRGAIKHDLSQKLHQISHLLLCADDASG